MKEDCNLDTLRTIEVRNIKQKLTPDHDKQESQDVFDSTNQNRKLSQHHYQRVVWLVDLMPRWIMGGIAFTCKYWRPLAAPRATLTIFEAMRELDVAVLLWQRSFLYVSINKFLVCQWTDQSHWEIHSQQVYFGSNGWWFPSFLHKDFHHLIAQNTKR